MMIDILKAFVFTVQKFKRQHVRLILIIFVVLSIKLLKPIRFEILMYDVYEI